MVWPNFLKGILPKKFFSPELKVLDSVEEIKLASDNTISKDRTEQSIVNHGTLVLINNPTDRQVDKMLKNINIRELDPGDTILEAGPRETLKQIETTFEKSDVQKEIILFKNVVPPKDMAILESAIFIQAQYDAGQKVGEYMRDIAITYGPRGSMICHLYSAGYYHDLILPLYKDLMENQEPKEDEFNEAYETFVRESPLAMFVSHRNSKDDIKKQILSKIKINKAAEVNYLHIHGIGYSNLNAIKQVLKDEEVKKLLVGEPKITEKNKMYDITIYF